MVVESCAPAGPRTWRKVEPGPPPELPTLDIVRPDV